MLKWAFSLALLLPAAAYAQTAAIQNHCFQGGTQAQLSGMSSTNYQEGIIPSCTVTVYLTGTVTKASIFSNGSGGTLSNPFTANTASSTDPGGWIFWAATGQGYDVVMSGGIVPNTYQNPVTLTDVQVGGAGGGGGGVSPGTQFHVGVYAPGGVNIQNSNLFTDSAGNNLNVPGNTVSYQIGNDFFVTGAPATCSGGTTPLDCAVIAATAYAQTTASPIVLHLAPGVNVTVNGIYQSLLNRISIEGCGQFCSTIQQTASISTAPIFYDCFASSTSDANAAHFSNFNIDANNLAPQALAVYGQNLSYIDHVAVKGANGPNNFVQLGSTSCSAGHFGGTFQMPINDLYIDGKGTGPGSWAQGSVSISAGVPSVTIANGGTYTHAAPPGYLVGYGAGSTPCSAMGTVTVATTPSGSQFTVTGVTLSGFSGCVVGNGAYIFIPDLPLARYGIDLQFWTDGVANMLVTNAVGQTAGIRNANSGNVFIGAHPYNSYTGIQDDAGGKWFGIDADSNEYMMKLTQPTQVSGVGVFYNSPTAFKGAGVFLLANGSNGSTFVSNTAVTGSLNSDFHAFITTAGGPIDTGQGSWPSNDIDIGSPNIDPNGLNLRHQTGNNATDDSVGFRTLATASVNSNSFNRFWCHSDWNGSAPVQNCWAMFAAASSSGIPGQDALHIVPPAGSLAPVSGRFLLFDAPANATAGGNVNSITEGLRGSYWNGSAAVSVGPNHILSIGSGTTPTLTYQINWSACPGTVCRISTNGDFNSTNGYQIGGAAPSAHYPRGNGTDYVDSAIQQADLPNTSPQVATPTAGHASCIKSSGPPVVIGFCSTQPDASGLCTCN